MRWILLQYVGDKAFYSFAGQILLEGEYLKLSELGYRAFISASATTSTIDLTNAPNLKTVGRDAFYSFKGQILLGGAYPALTELGGAAFSYASAHGDIGARPHDFSWTFGHLHDIYANFISSMIKSWRKVSSMILMPTSKTPGGNQCPQTPTIFHHGARTDP